ncbi:MAG: hypothetical protein CEE38_02315 [Planctomycetes bacterium B3_Pla]|nr:MAG: hypothetical protein CEE38_02315 [Planctomycetes bacterium B3_Pla]
MKLILGLLAFICFSTITIYLSVEKRMDHKLTVILLAFSILSGIAIANYDVIRKFKFGGLEVETAKKEISDAKDDAISAIKQEIEKQKESVAILTRDANVTSDKIEKQKSEINTLVKTAQELEKEIVKRKEETLLLSRDTQESRKEIETLNIAAQQIALTLVKATYLTLSTKSEFGTSSRLTKATKEIENDINRILPIVMPDSEERSQWINDLKDILPPRN